MKKNYSYTYLLPLLSEQIDIQKSILINTVNTFLFTNKSGDETKFFILCSFDYSNTEFGENESRLTNNDLFVTSHEIDDKILYEYNFPEGYEKERDLFIQGKYSLFGDDAKELILRYWSELYGHIPSFVTGTLLKIKQILYKDEKLREKMSKELKTKIHRDSELGNKIDEEKETFFFNEDGEKKISLEDLKKLWD